MQQIIYLCFWNIVVGSDLLCSHYLSEHVGPHWSQRCSHVSPNAIAAMPQVPVTNKVAKSIKNSWAWRPIAGKMWRTEPTPGIFGWIFAQQKHGVGIFWGELHSLELKEDEWKKTICGKGQIQNYSIPPAPSLKEICGVCSVMNSSRMWTWTLAMTGYSIHYKQLGFPHLGSSET